MRETQREPDLHDDVRARIVAAGQRILAEGGRAALTTRAVSAAAGVQAPTLYRLFGDMNGLLEAIAEDALRIFTQDKQRRTVREPLEDLRVGWDLTVAFGLAHPAIYLFMVGEPRPDGPSPAAAAGEQVLRGKLHALAKAGLLRVTEERALALVRATGIGTILVLLGMPETARDPGLSAAARESVIAAITHERPVIAAPRAKDAAIALHASLDDVDRLTAGETLLLGELLARLAAS